MSKMPFIVSNNFQKSPSTGAFRPQRPLTFDFGDLMLRDLSKLCFSNWLWQNRIKKISYDVIL